MRTWTRRAVVAATAMVATAMVPAAAGGAPTTCFGEPVTITAVPGRITNGTSGPDVIVGTAGPDIINGRGGDDLICSRGGADVVDGGKGSDSIDLGRGDDTASGGSGHDTIRGRAGDDTIAGNRGRDRLIGGAGRDDLSGGPHADHLRGNSGRDVLDGGAGPDRLHGGAAGDVCRGGGGADAGHKCETTGSLTERLDDDFAGDGGLIGYTTSNRGALPEVERRDGRYRAALVDNTDDVTLHYHLDQGRLDAKMVEFPFDVVVRNVGIGTIDESQVAPTPNGWPYVFAGVQVHVPDLGDPNSSHVVVGHRGNTHFTIEGKNTRDGHSSVDDIGAGTAPDGRADIRIVGNADRTLTVYWQTPNPAPGVQADSWHLYNGTGTLPGQAPDYPNAVYIGLITYAFGSNGVPFVGTADAIEDYSQSCPC